MDEAEAALSTCIIAIFTVFGMQSLVSGEKPKACVFLAYFDTVVLPKHVKRSRVYNLSGVTRLAFLPYYRTPEMEAVRPNSY